MTRAHAALLVLALAGCYTAPKLPVIGYESDEFACKDGIDNDGDGQIDCVDADCFVEFTFCGQLFPLVPRVVPENTPMLCHDRVDNDGDGQMDCQDRNCQNVPETCCSLEFSDAECSDGKDNDGNGFADCADFSCSMGSFVTVCVEGSDATCADGKDNDKNGYTDCDDANCQYDPACQATTTTSTNLEYRLLRTKPTNSRQHFLSLSFKII